MEKKTVKYHIPKHGIYMYARINDGKTELIILNNSEEEQKVQHEQYASLIKHSLFGTEIGTGERIDLRHGLVVAPQRSMIIEL